MRKTGRKALAAGLAGMMAASMMLAGCGNSKESAGTSAAGGESTEAAGTEAGTTEASAEDGIVKPEKIKVFVNGNVFTQANGRDEFEKRWEELTGIDLEITQPDHDAYNDVLGQTFASGPENWPDVVILSSSYYTGYAEEGALWDMTDAWENSELKASGRYKGEAILDKLKIDGKLYGFAHESGKGCITYIKKSWLDNVGMEAPTTYDEYLKMLEAFSTQDPDGNGVNGDTYGVSAAGFVAPEAPWTMYLPEFYQGATVDFVKDENGKWVDGFLQDNMKETLQRMQDAYEAGYIDKETLTNGTKDCRTKYFEDKYGVFTYWSGTWGTTIMENLAANGHDDELVALPPIEELDGYIAKLPNVMAITSACENPEGVFKYFIESILDGGEMQKLWTYGVEDVHWSTKAETVCDNTYEDGQFHFEESLEVPGTQYSKGYIDPLLSLADWVEEDPGADAIAPFTREAQDEFDKHAVQLDLIPSTDMMTQYNGDLMTLKRSIVAEIVTQGVSVEEGYQRFEAENGVEWSNAIVDSLNNQ